MKRLVVLLFIFVAANPHVTFAQKDSSEHAKQRRAEQVADRFVNHFRATLDFGRAWKAFRLSDPSCTHRANGNLSESDYERFKLNSRTIEKLYIATMNLYYHKGVYEFSLARIDSQSDSDDSLTPNEAKVITKRSRFFQNDDREPQNAKEVGELISTFNQLSAAYRKHMPAGAMKSPAWRANQKISSLAEVWITEALSMGMQRFVFRSRPRSISLTEGYSIFTWWKRNIR